MSAQKIIPKSSHVGDEFQPVFKEPILAVLDIDPSKPIAEREWAVYVGPESEGQDYILKYGSKVSREFAELLFPNVHGRYRV